MPRHCSAIGCCTRDTRETRSRGISFHRLPKKDKGWGGTDTHERTLGDHGGEGLWDPASKYIYFCSQHFEKSCFEIVGFSGYHRLKEGAVPTLFNLVTPRPHRPEGSAPAGDHGAVAALPGSSEARGPSPKPPPEAPGSGPVPPSPSLYVLRLPPRLGAYIQSEHSYQVGNALLWKRRAEAALEALGKAQRQLQACKRREQRLRLRVGELQRERRWDAREAAVKREDGDGGQ
ncbi:LOW QUALITY PROTEIN: THAP domain-containing protein 7-like [Pezoporus flaviventris]|uniref:LOW QUALITY PROTEIN: THAP domain-containing protein 7-like n=1 Tax=Pezoporus flaviventris TaxID=889875 RepID=UPI002AAF22D9|nr:LOW QUALITY PROTEIN: THAP domain-containing protein 7-like [Pezoporus flaviventris]